MKIFLDSDELSVLHLQSKEDEDDSGNSSSGGDNDDNLGDDLPEGPEPDEF